MFHNADLLLAHVNTSEKARPIPHAPTMANTMAHAGLPRR
jgi:hypothetical protein